MGNKGEIMLRMLFVLLLCSPVVAQTTIEKSGTGVAELRATYAELEAAAKGSNWTLRLEAEPIPEDPNPTPETINRPVIVQLSGFPATFRAAQLEPGCEAISIREEWTALEPARNVYKWGRLDTQVAAARQLGIPFQIRMRAGKYSPKWITGEKHLLEGVMVPAPWNPDYRTQVSEMLRDIARRYPDCWVIHNAGILRNSESHGRAWRNVPGYSAARVARYFEIQYEAVRGSSSTIWFSQNLGTPSANPWTELQIANHATWHRSIIQTNALAAQPPSPDPTNPPPWAEHVLKAPTDGKNRVIGWQALCGINATLNGKNRFNPHGRPQNGLPYCVELGCHESMPLFVEWYIWPTKAQSGSRPSSTEQLRIALEDYYELP